MMRELRVRKTRDYDAELRALSEKAKALKAKKVEQLGQLVTSTGADTLDLDILAGILITAVETTSAEEKEAWRAKGFAFFQRRGNKARG
jgi:hypothetical protein